MAQKILRGTSDQEGATLRDAELFADVPDVGPRDRIVRLVKSSREASLLADESQDAPQALFELIRVIAVRDECPVQLGLPRRHADRQTACEYRAEAGQQWRVENRRAFCDQLFEGRVGLIEQCAYRWVGAECAKKVGVGSRLEERRERGTFEKQNRVSWQRVHELLPIRTKLAGFGSRPEARRTERLHERREKRQHCEADECREETQFHNRAPRAGVNSSRSDRAMSLPAGERESENDESGCFAARLQFPHERK